MDDVQVFCISDVGISVAAEHVLQWKILGFSLGKGFLNPFYLQIMIALRTATAGEGTIPGKQVIIFVEGGAIGSHGA